MLSMTPLKDAQHAKSYYEKDNYYAKDSVEAAELSHWWGKGATTLGLSGYVKIEEFEQLLQGKLPNGQQLGRSTANGKKHRPAYDLTFSAPKSFAILAEIGGDKRLYQAHREAVKEALAYLEKCAVKTRAFRAGEIVFEQVGNLTVALFQHDTSRELDPETHTHAVVLNMVQRTDGEWRSISSESLFDHKMTAGLIYRNHLAMSAQKMGYGIEKTHEDGRFEITGIEKEALTHFSQRRQQIEARLEKEGWEGAKASAKVALDTRLRKREVDRGTLLEDWLQRCATLNFDPQQLVEQSRQQQNNPPQSAKVIARNEKAIAQEAVNYAMAHLSEREAVFPDRDLIRTALAHSLGQTSLAHVTQAIQEVSHTGDLIAVNPDYWTTLTALKIEEDNIRLMKEAQGQCIPIVTPEQAQAFLLQKEQSRTDPYTKGQREAIALILTTTDKVIGVQGNPGSGKTTLLEAVREAATHAGYDLLAVAPTKNVASELESKTGIASMTLQKYLVTTAKNGSLAQPGKPLLILLDEASMVSSTQMNELLQRAKHPYVRVAMLGDVKQLAAILAGKPFDQLQRAGMKTAHMDEILRQKNSLLKEAVYDTIAGEIQDAFTKVDITEEGNKDKRLEKIVDDYLSYSPEGRERTLVLIPANDDRILVNQGIRQGLKNEGLLHGEEAATTTFASRGFTKPQRQRVTNYAPDNIVRFNKNYKHMDIHSGDYFKVVQIHRQRNEMELEHVTTGKRIAWNPEKAGGKRDGAIEVYELQERALMTGDKIRWLRNVGDDFINAKTAEVLSVTGQHAQVRLHDQRIVTLDLNHLDHKHWDYAFAYTLHAKQGGESARVIAHFESFRKRLTTQRAFYVAISRALYGARLFVDDSADCIKSIKKYTGEKLSALDALSGVDPEEYKKTAALEQPLRPIQTQTAQTPGVRPKPAKYWDAQDLQQRLSQQVEELARQLLGEPNHHLSTAKNLRYGKNGSLAIAVGGKHAGTWHSFESGEKGNLIQLIQHTTSLEFKEALDYAGRFLGLSPDSAPLAPHMVAQATRKKDPQALDDNDLKAIARARKIEEGSLPIQGTLAERYLREHRGITGDLPDTFRYHPRVVYHYVDEQTKVHKKEYFPALVLIAKDQRQKTQAVQVVYLDSKTANKAAVAVTKRTHGRPSLGATVNINPGRSKVMLAEGPETGLSIAQAYPQATVMVTLSASNFSNAQLAPHQKEVIICMDNDIDNAASYQAVLKAAQIHAEHGHHVYLAKPDTVKDFNDVLKAQGEDAIRDTIDSAVAFKYASPEKDHSVDFAANSMLEQRQEVMRGIVSVHSENKAVDFAADLTLEKHRQTKDFSAVHTDIEMQPLADLPAHLGSSAFTAKELENAAELVDPAYAMVDNKLSHEELISLDNYLEQVDLPKRKDDFSIEI